MFNKVVHFLMALFIVSGILPAGGVNAIGIGDITPESSSAQSVFSYGWQGLFTGALTGLAAGYVRYGDENNSEEILRSVGYGSVAGAGFGLAMGIVDVNNGHSGLGRLVIRDMNLGGAFGMAVGSIYGGIDAIAREDWKSLGDGASWGYLSGLVLGTGIAFYENSHPGATLTSADDGNVVYSIVMLRDSEGTSCTGIGATCRF